MNVEQAAEDCGGQPAEDAGDPHAAVEDPDDPHTALTHPGPALDRSQDLGVTHTAVAQFGSH